MDVKKSAAAQQSTLSQTAAAKAEKSFQRMNRTVAPATFKAAVEAMRDDDVISYPRPAWKPTATSSQKDQNRYGNAVDEWSRFTEAMTLDFRYADSVKAAEKINTVITGGIYSLAGQGALSDTDAAFALDAVAKATASRLTQIAEERTSADRARDARDKACKAFPGECSGVGQVE